MKKILVLSLLVISSISYSQEGEGPMCDGGDMYLNDCLFAWVFVPEFQICTQLDYSDCYGDPMAGDLMNGGPFFETEQCCCQEFNLPGCQVDENNVSLNENNSNTTNGFYIDLLGNVYKEQPKGFSIMNGVKYYKF
jgi:hypothetical protein